ACAYPFEGSTMSITSGTYANTTTTPYRYKTDWTGMAVNQPNVATRLLTLTGGTFSKVDPKLGDDAGLMANFVHEDFWTIPAEGGGWEVVPRINIALATVSVAEDLVYDATEQAGVTNVVYTFEGDDMPTKLFEGTDYTVAYTDNVNAGDDTAKAELTGIGLYYGTTNVTFSIAQKPVTFTGASAEKVYDGTALATNDFAVAGLVEGHTATATVTGSQTDVGVSSNVVSNAAISDGSNDVTANYDISYVDGELEVTVKEVTVTVTASVSTNAYTGVTQTFTPVLSYESDEAEGSVLFDATKVTTNITATLTRKDVGTTNQGLAPEQFGYDDDNLAVTFVIAQDGELTITKATVTVTANDATKVYGDPDPEFSWTASGLLEGDTTDFLVVTVTRTDADTLEGRDVGIHQTIMPAGDAEQGNYNVEYVAGKLTITKRRLTVAIPTITTTYNGQEQKFTLSAPTNSAEYISLGEGVFAYPEDEALFRRLWKYTVVGTNVNDVATVDSGLNEDDETLDEDFDQIRKNYNWNLMVTAGGLVIEPVELTVTVKDEEITYGDDAPVYSFTYAGFVDGEDERKLDTEPTATCSYNTASAATRHADVYDITAANGVAYKGNYTFNYVDGTLTVEKKEITITADSDTKSYDGTALTDDGYTITPADGLAWDDAIESVTIESSQTNVGSTDNVATAAAIRNGNVYVTDDYDITFVNGTLEVTATAVTIKADDVGKVYDDDTLTDPELTVTVTGLPENGAALVYTIARREGQDVGGYAISVTANAEDNPNYLITVEEGGVFTISPKALTVTAVDATKIAGNDDPEFTATAEGLVDGHVLDSYAIARTDAGDDTAGEHATIEPSAAVIKNGNGDVVTGNYAITYVNGTLTVSAAEAMVISAPDAETGACTTNYYATLPGGFSAAKAEETVAMLANVSLNEAVPLPAGNLTFIRNGNELALFRNAEFVFTNATTVFRSEVEVKDVITLAGDCATGYLLRSAVDGDMNVYSLAQRGFYMVIGDKRDGTPGSASIKVSDEWVTANIKPIEEVTSVNEVEDFLNSTNAVIGMREWEKYVLNQTTNFTVTALSANDAIATTLVEPASSETTGFTVAYALNLTDRDGAFVSAAVPAQASRDGLSLPSLDGVESNAVYRVSAELTSGEDTLVVGSANMIGVLNVSVSTNELSALAVPWTAFGGGAITVADYVRTGTLSEDDQLQAYDAENDVFLAWSLKDDGTWEAMETYKESTGEIIQAPEANEYLLPRGKGVWLNRYDVSDEKSVYLVGEWVPNRACTTPLKAAEGGAPSWNLVGNPFVDPVDVSTFAQDGDQIQVPTSGLPKNYEKRNGVWGYWTTERYERRPGVWATRSKFEVEDVAIPAGTGFWYLNNGEAKDINW
ncbi:MAG: hypothetical protein IKE55_10265, partial [Kiritimatiellae bacterium]|nr:hypothetical protein [Kiritimatiellia bacterium]